MSTPRVDRWAGPIYLDASAVVKLFVPEAESDDLNEALVGAEDVVLSDLAPTETASAFGRRAREGLLAPAESRRLHREADAATLVTYDPRLRAAAVLQGLFVAPETGQ